MKADSANHNINPSSLIVEPADRPFVELAAPPLLVPARPPEELDEPEPPEEPADELPEEPDELPEEPLDPPDDPPEEPPEEPPPLDPGRSSWAGPRSIPPRLVV